MGGGTDPCVGGGSDQGSCADHPPPSPSRRIPPAGLRASWRPARRLPPLRVGLCAGRPHPSAALRLGVRGSRLRSASARRQRMLVVWQDPSPTLSVHERRCCCLAWLPEVGASDSAGMISLLFSFVHLMKALPDRCGISKFLRRRLTGCGVQEPLMLSSLDLLV